MVVAQFQRRLVELGCPSKTLAEKVRELADHHEDIKVAAMEDGMSEEAAAALADARLGNPVLLAENAVAVFREASWWGRHPVVAYCVLPVFTFLPVQVLCFLSFGGLCWLLGRWFGRAYSLDQEVAGLLSSDPGLFSRFIMPVNVGLACAAVLLCTVLFCALARRAAVGFRWMLIASVFCSVGGVFSYTVVQSHNITFGYSNHPDHWYYAFIPVGVGLVLWVRQRSRELRLAAVPMPPAASLRRTRLHRSWRTTILMPTFWVTAFLLGLLVALIGAQIRYEMQEAARLTRTHIRVWPGERAATLAELRNRQAEPAPAGQQPVNLADFVNAGLAVPVNGAKDNNLAALPAGRRVFAGSVFDVQGRIQLADPGAKHKARKYPSRVNGIPVARTCSKLCVLHGASGVSALGSTIATLVLHYADGSKAVLDIKAGAQVLDWWGPIYNTDSGDGRYLSSPDSELAWAGSNPSIRNRSPDFSLRVYRTTFANPQPYKEIATVDFTCRPRVSDLAATPFLLGLTTEK